MKKLTALMCCLTISAAPFAVAQTKAPASPPANPPPPARVVVEMKADPRTETCKREAVDKNLTGAARENFLTACLKR